MGRERRTSPAGDDARAWSATARVAVCAADPELAGRVRHALTLAGHELAGTCVGLLELIEDLSLLGAEAAVAVVDPSRDATPIMLFRRRLPHIPLILVLPSLRGPDSGRLLSADVDGLVVADEIERALAPVLASVLADQVCVPSDARPALAGPVFSHREKQVLSLLLAGLTNSEIASRLYLSESTVKSHLSSSFRKLGVSSRAEILRRARTPDSALSLPLGLARTLGEPSPALA